MSDFQEDFDFQAQFLPELKRICGEQLVLTAPLIEDLRHNTDLLVLAAANIRIACRVREYRFFAEATRDDITIRFSRPSGSETEMAKIQAGWGDYMLYGIAERGEARRLAGWKLIDLHHFRAWLIRHAPVILGDLHVNKDGTTFYSFHTGLFPPGIVWRRWTRQGPAPRPSGPLRRSTYDTGQARCVCGAQDWLPHALSPPTCRVCHGPYPLNEKGTF